MSLLRLFSQGLCVLLFSYQAIAQNIPLQNLDEESLKKVTGDFSANFSHTTVSGASPLGHVFGFELGVIGGTTNTPHIQEIAQATDPSVNVKSLYDAAIIGLLSVPMGITVEAGLVPKVGNDNFKFNTFSLGVKWTPTEIFLDWPLSAAIRGTYTRSDAEFNQTINTIPTVFKFIDTQTALTLLVSKNFAILEPYLGFGIVNAKGDLTATGSTTVFNNSYSSTGQAAATRSGTQFLLGTEVKLLVVKLGVEYSRMFDTGRVAGKLSFYF